MTDRVNPTLDGGASSRRTAAAIRFAGGSRGWVVPATDDPGELATDHPDIDETALNAFAETSSSTSLDVTIDPGQAYVGGAWLARDIATTVTLTASSTQTVYVGWDVAASNTVLVGLASAFDADDPTTPLWTFDTDAGGVTSTTDDRRRDYRIAAEDVDPTAGRDPLYGDGSDGAITRTTDGSDAGIIYATRYEIEAGVTRTGNAIIHATEEIVIDGTLHADGRGGNGASRAGGGSGGSSSSGGNGDDGTFGAAGEPVSQDGSGGSGGAPTSIDGEDGGSATFAGAGGGGGAGGSDDYSGGSGGAGQNGTSRTWSANEIRQLHQFLTSSYDSMYDLSFLGGTGGSSAGGGGGGGADGSSNGGNGGFGGAGGDGGGWLLLVAPKITVNGTVRAAGSDGENGGNGGDGAFNAGGGGGGGGGAGGSGGFVGFVTANLSEAGTVSVPGGTAGTGGTGGQANNGGNLGGDGGAGSDGADGLLLRMVP